MHSPVLFFVGTSVSNGKGQRKKGIMKFFHCRHLDQFLRWKVFRMWVVLSFLDISSLLAGSVFTVCPIFLIKVNCVLDAFAHMKTKDAAISDLSTCKEGESTFRCYHTGICTGGTYAGFMCSHCLRAGSKCGTAPRRKEITAYNIQLVTITPTHPRFNIRTIFHVETEIVQNMGLL